ncbi:ribose-5-phosphate isomerase RpiA [Edaphobacter flagellatus]|uniref:ribose-5-phosphate isomerase RpiA n=1 Tax=Edaphobacter flagellatus TaxID=1933044 RepID=UPI0021B34E8F|nr:ribose-5-phosphate isomerase RpiA [Edaphobacter flagellatus]
MTQGLTQDGAKRMAARHALEFVEDGMSLGLGTGTTSAIFIQELGERVKGGLKVRGIATSAASQKLAESLSIPITNFEETPELDLAIDGADEVGPGLALIKGGGGALLREKIVESAARKFIVIADSSKLVQKLGKFPLPVEVIQMAKPTVERRLAALGLNPKLRHHADGSKYITDENNFILDCFCGEIDDPAKTAADIRAIVGVVEHGLFLNMASFALIASDQGVAKVAR